MLCRLALVWNLPPLIMATLSSLLADRTSSSELGFRINDKPSISADGKETLWANAWVNDKEGKLLCIGATVETLEKMQAEGLGFDKLMLTQPEAKIASTGLQYDMCQLAIAKIDFSFSLK